MKKIVLVIALVALLLVGAVAVTVITESEKVSASLGNCATMEKVCWGGTINGCTSWKFYCVEDV